MKKFNVQRHENNLKFFPAIRGNRSLTYWFTHLEECAYSDDEMYLYDKYWDAVSVEKTLLSDGLTGGRVEGEAERKALEARIAELEQLLNKNKE